MYSSKKLKRIRVGLYSIKKIWAQWRKPQEDRSRDRSEVIQQKGKDKPSIASNQKSHERQGRIFP